MSRDSAVAAAFRSLCLGKLGFLEQAGFRRAPELEQSSPTTCSVVYLGHHVGFVFSLDLRDDCVDVRILQLGEGQAAASRVVEREMDLFDHLVRNRGYRGGLPATRGGSEPASEGERWRESLEGLIELLETVGADLFRDDPASLGRR